MEVKTRAAGLVMAPMNEKKESAHAPKKHRGERTEVEEAKKRLVGEEAVEEGKNRPPSRAVGDDS